MSKTDNRATYVFHTDWLIGWEYYDDGERLQMYDAITLYATSGAEPKFADRSLMRDFAKYKAQIDYDRQKYDERCATNKANREKGLTKNNNCQQSSTNVNNRQQSGSDNDSDSDSDSDYDYDSDNEREFTTNSEFDAESTPEEKKKSLIKRFKDLEPKANGFFLDRNITANTRLMYDFMTQAQNTGLIGADECENKLVLAKWLRAGYDRAKNEKPFSGDLLTKNNELIKSAFSAYLGYATSGYNQDDWCRANGINPPHKKKSKPTKESLMADLAFTWDFEMMDYETYSQFHLERITKELHGTDSKEYRDMYLKVYGKPYEPPAVTLPF